MPTLTGTFVGTMIANASLMTTLMFLQHYLYMHDVEGRSRGIRIGFHIAVSSLIGIVAMLFSYQVGEDVIFDARLVPVLLLSLFAAQLPWHVPLVVAALISGARFFFSVSAGAYVSLAVMLSTALLLLVVNKLFLERRRFPVRLGLHALIGTAWASGVLAWQDVLVGERVWQYFLLLLGSVLAMGVVSQVLFRDLMQHHNLRVRAETDFLTGLQNRASIDAFLDEHFALAARRREEMSVAILDIDHFKEVNDTYGHETGDLVIQHAARLIQQNVRSYDQVARYGGEEFLVVFPHLNKQAASEIAERIRRSFEQAVIRVGEEIIPLTVSIGVASLTEGQPRDFKRVADDRLYQAKRSGRNRIVYEG